MACTNKSGEEQVASLPLTSDTEGPTVETSRDDTQASSSGAHTSMVESPVETAATVPGSTSDAQTFGVNTTDETGANHNTGTFVAPTESASIQVAENSESKALPKLLLFYNHNNVNNGDEITKKYLFRLEDSHLALPTAAALNAIPQQPSIGQEEYAKRVRNTLRMLDVPLGYHDTPTNADRNPRFILWSPLKIRSRNGPPVWTVESYKEDDIKVSTCCSSAKPQPISRHLNLIHFEVTEDGDQFLMELFICNPNDNNYVVELTQRLNAVEDSQSRPDYFTKVSQLLSQAKATEMQCVHLFEDRMLQENPSGDWVTEYSFDRHLWAIESSPPRHALRMFGGLDWIKKRVNNDDDSVITCVEVIREELRREVRETTDFTNRSTGPLPPPPLITRVEFKMGAIDLPVRYNNNRPLPVPDESDDEATDDDATDDDATDDETTNNEDPANQQSPSTGPDANDPNTDPSGPSNENLLTEEANTQDAAPQSESKTNGAMA